MFGPGGLEVATSEELEPMASSDEGILLSTVGHSEIWFNCECNGRPTVGGTVLAERPWSFICSACGRLWGGDKSPEMGRVVSIQRHDAFVCWVTIFDQVLEDGHKYQWQYESEVQPDDSALKWYEQDFGIRIARTLRIIRDRADPGGNGGIDPAA